MLDSASIILVPERTQTPPLDETNGVTGQNDYAVALFL